jgi:hypothetical protein
MFGRANATPTIKPIMKASSIRIRIVSIIDELEKLVDCIKSKPGAEKMQGFLF